MAFPRRVLMCPPYFFEVRHKLNPQMEHTLESDTPVLQSEAIRQWNNLVATLIKEGISVFLIPPEPHLPDMVFTANAGFMTAKDELLLSRFKCPERVPESFFFSKYFRDILWRDVLVMPETMRNTEEVPLEGVYFEGHGDALWYGDTLCVGFGFRSSQAGIHEAMRRVGIAEYMELQLVDRSFYHLDTCFCPVGDSLIYYPGAFSDDSQEKIMDLVESRGGSRVVVSRKDALNFACNGIPIWREGGWKLITSRVSRGLHLMLSDLKIKVISVSTSEFQKSGGGARCLVLFI